MGGTRQICAPCLYLLRMRMSPCPNESADSCAVIIIAVYTLQYTWQFSTAGTGSHTVHLSNVLSDRLPHFPAALPDALRPLALRALAPTVVLEHSPHMPPVRDELVVGIISACSLTHLTSLSLDVESGHMLHPCETAALDLPAALSSLARSTSLRS